jgi:hypothetical protein
MDQRRVGDMRALSVTPLLALPHFETGFEVLKRQSLLLPGVPIVFGCHFATGALGNSAISTAGPDAREIVPQWHELVRRLLRNAVPKRGDPRYSCPA